MLNESFGSALSLKPAGEFRQEREHKIPKVEKDRAVVGNIINGASRKRPGKKVQSFRLDQEIISKVLKKMPQIQVFAGKQCCNKDLSLQMSHLFFHL